MVDATQAAESSYINADLVKQSPTKIIIPIDAGKYEDGTYGERLKIGVELDGKSKTYCPNKSSAENLIAAFGKDTKGWLGKKIKLLVIEEKVYAEAVEDKE